MPTMFAKHDVRHESADWASTTYFEEKLDEIKGPLIAEAFDECGEVIHLQRRIKALLFRYFGRPVSPGSDKYILDSVATEFHILAAARDYAPKKKECVKFAEVYANEVNQMSANLTAFIVHNNLVSAAVKDYEALSIIGRGTAISYMMGMYEVVKRFRQGDYNVGFYTGKDMEKYPNPPWYPAWGKVQGDLNLVIPNVRDIVVDEKRIICYYQIPGGGKQVGKKQFSNKQFVEQLSVGHRQEIFGSKSWKISNWATDLMGRQGIWYHKHEGK